MKETNKKTWKLTATLLAIILLVSCSHNYTPDTLDLSFYQWNQWPDEQSRPDSEAGAHPPSCGWDVMHRGIGTLVRIPATLRDYRGVSWYHCRFTLPENWENRKIAFEFEGAGPEVEVYLNEELIGERHDSAGPFKLDVTDRIFYTRDNHLAVRISDPKGKGGITGNILVRSDDGQESLSGE